MLRPLEEFVKARFAERRAQGRFVAECSHGLIPIDLGIANPID